MRVAELIKRLGELDPEEQIMVLYPGKAMGEPIIVHLQGAKRQQAVIKGGVGVDDLPADTPAVLLAGM